MKLICLMRLFWNALASSRQEDEEQGLKLAELLMAPLLLPCRTCHIHPGGYKLKPVQVPLPASPTRKSKIKSRPQTPAAVLSIRLAPLNQEAIVQENEGLESSECEPTITILKPAESRNKISRSSLESNEQNYFPIPIQIFHEKIKAAVAQSNAEACSYLSKRPDMKQLEAEDLFKLLQYAHNLSKNSRNARRLFLELFEEIVDAIVPKNYPHHFQKFIILIAKPEVPERLFSLACKHVKLLSKHSLNDLIRKIEINYIWDQIERVDHINLKKFNFRIIEIADNLEKCQDLVRLDYVKKIISMTNGETLGKSIVKTLSKVQFIYMTTYLLGALKSIDSQDNNDQMKESLRNLIKVVRNDLRLKTDVILELIEPVLKAILPKLSQEQAEPFGRFMAILHEIILEQPDVPLVPSSMIGCEDLYLYITSNSINSAQARLKYYRSNRLTKGQLLTLLIAAELANQGNSNLILMILASIQVNQSDLSKQDFENLGLSSRTALKILFTIPRRFEGQICTPNPELKHTESVSWKLPEDLFISQDPGIYAFILTDTLLNIPRLFLYRVFGLPLMNFAEVESGMNEIPEMKELIDISNFFLDKWCSNEDSYPKVKIVL
jgi:hypothetical protein